MQNKQGSGWGGDLLSAFFLCAAGFLLVHTIESELLSGQVVVAIAFGMNVIAIARGSSEVIKIRVRRLSASFLVGALIAFVSF